MPSSARCSSPPPEAVTPAFTVIACGALASHIREIAARLALPIEVVPLPAALHNHPDRIAPAAERLAVSLRSRGRRVALGHAGRGRLGARPRRCAPLGVPRAGGLA